MKYFSYFLVSMLLILSAGDQPASALQKIDNSIYASLLKTHVSPTGQVNYNGFKKDEIMLDQYLHVLSHADISQLTQTEKFAYFINVYNAFTIKLILMHYPGINSIKEIGTFFTNPWQKKFIPLNGRNVTLDYIEHEILRPQFKDPRVHFAINCASKSCPILRNEPYEAEALESQLSDQARIFINNKARNRVRENTLYVSKIFKWFKEDFQDNPLIIIRQYANDEFKTAIQNLNPNIDIKYLDYDWSLNQ